MEASEKVSPFWTIRKQIAIASNDEEIQLASQVFRKAVSEGVIDREEERILEAFLVVYASKIISNPKKATDLPPGYKSWFQLLKKSEPYSADKEVVAWSIGSYLYSDLMPMSTKYLFDIDYIKARAMEEIMEQLPDKAEDFLALAYAVREFRGPSDDLENKLHSIHRFYLDAGLY